MEVKGKQRTRKGGHSKIYSLYDEEYHQYLSLEAFSKVLEMWTVFLQSKPDALEPLTVSIDKQRSCCVWRQEARPKWVGANGEVRLLQES